MQFKYNSVKEETKISKYKKIKGTVNRTYSEFHVDRFFLLAIRLDYAFVEQDQFAFIGIPCLCPGTYEWSGGPSILNIRI